MNTSALHLTPGDRIAMVAMGVDPVTGVSDPDPVVPGSKGTATRLVPWCQDGTVIVEVDWDSGRTLHAILPIDKVRLIARPRTKYFEQQLECA